MEKANRTMPMHERMAEFFKHFVDNLPERCTMFFWFSNIVENGPVMDRIYDLLHERGHSPQAMGLA